MPYCLSRLPYLRPGGAAIASIALLALLGCGPAGEPGSAAAPESGPAPAAALTFERVGRLQDARIDEASGIQALGGGRFVVHNDEGTRLFRIDAAGRDLGELEVGSANARDWEDITRVPGPDGPLLVIGDIGDNSGSRKDVSLYFLPEPADDVEQASASHRVRITYPDGPRDAESLAWDPLSGKLLILSKRDKPPRLYGVPLDLALWKHELRAEFLTEVPGFRPPTRRDIARNPMRGMWVSQPTGMDLSPDGRLAAVLTYRSLYLFQRRGDESWVQAFQGQPLEVIGPPGTHDEAVGFSADGRSVYVTTEGRPAPIYRLPLPDRLP